MNISLIHLMSMQSLYICAFSHTLPGTFYVSAHLTNLNVSETARKLFVHRNTLVYRLEKIKKLTGLDLREFDDAITFKVALMVKKYLTSRGIDA